MTGYLRDVDVSETWERLSSVENSILVDVRTRAEWSFVGVPDLGEINKEPVFQEWQVYPTMERVDNFSKVTSEAVLAKGGNANTEIFFLCRSGVRSQGAAAALTEVGFE
ncbi:MAG: rhodanese-like domain-containing protein, partial [Pseudomonadota bacterium]